MKAFPCACCEQNTLAQGGGNTQEVCSVCGWQDDGVQNLEPQQYGVPNMISLSQAKSWFQDGKTVEEARAVLCDEPNWGNELGNPDSGWGAGDDDGWDGAGEDDEYGV